MDRTRALQLARLSGLVYDDWGKVKTGLGVLGFVLVDEPWDHGDTQGMLVRNKLYSAIVFRGTEATKLRLRDIFSNFGHPSAWAGVGLAHSGYENAFGMVRYDARKLAERVSNDLPLYVTGHSMGGALASLYASWAGHRLAGLVSFGSPRAMNREACDAISCPVYRYENRHDFAPHYPPSFMLTHPGEAIKLDSGGWPGPVSRHSINRYIEALE